MVDDDQQLASALQWILADENFLVDVAFDGKAALLKVKAHEYDAVICDLKMPRLRGDEFYLQAKEMRPSLSDRFIFHHRLCHGRKNRTLPYQARREIFG